MRVHVIGWIRWNFWTWIKEVGERKNIPALKALGYRMRWGK